MIRNALIAAAFLAFGTAAATAEVPVDTNKTETVMALPDNIIASWRDDDDGGPVWTPTWLCPWRPLHWWDWCL